MVVTGAVEEDLRTADPKTKVHVQPPRNQHLGRKKLPNLHDRRRSMVNRSSLLVPILENHEVGLEPNNKYRERAGRDPGMPAVNHY